MAAGMSICCVSILAVMAVVTLGLSSVSAENRLGLCPADAQSDAVTAKIGGTSRNCSSSCSDDADCGKHSKCCPDEGCGSTCSEAVYACFHNGRIYLENEHVIDSNRCNQCICLDGYLVCEEMHCESDPTVDKTRILSLCLIVFGSCCFLGTVLSLLKYQLSKRPLRDEKNNMETFSMMADV